MPAIVSPQLSGNKIVRIDLLQTLIGIKGNFAMDNNLDSFVQRLQAQIFAETKKDFGEKVYKRWREPLYMGMIDKPDGHAKAKGKCGDSIEIFLKFEKNRVTQASFQTDGCGPSVVCGSYAAEMAIGKDPDELSEITGETILKRLGGLPEENEHCAFLAAESLQQALHDFMIRSHFKTSK